MNSELPNRLGLRLGLRLRAKRAVILNGAKDLLRPVRGTAGQRSFTPFRMTAGRASSPVLLCVLPGFTRAGCVSVARPLSSPTGVSSRRGEQSGVVSFTRPGVWNMDRRTLWLAGAAAGLVLLG